MDSYIKGGMQAKGIWKHNPEANIWARVIRMGTGEGFITRNFLVCTVFLILSGRLSLEAWVCQIILAERRRLGVLSKFQQVIKQERDI